MLLQNLYGLKGKRALWVRSIKEESSYQTASWKSARSLLKIMKAVTESMFRTAGFRRSLKTWLMKLPVSVCIVSFSDGTKWLRLHICVTKVWKKYAFSSFWAQKTCNKEASKTDAQTTSSERSSGPTLSSSHCLFPLHLYFISPHSSRVFVRELNLDRQANWQHRLRALLFFLTTTDLHSVCSDALIHLSVTHPTLASTQQDLEVIELLHLNST